MPIQPCEVPPHSFLNRYKIGDGYADCYVTEVPGAIAQAAFIEAFYTSPLFKIERALLKIFAGKSATDADVRQLALGNAETFSAWNVEDQTRSELLLADMSGRTRSWLMVSPVEVNGGAPRTLLYFGSAVLPRQRADGQRPSLGWMFVALLGFHRLYSRLLLRAASRRVRASG